MSDAFAPWRNAPFRRFVLARFLASLGSQMLGTAIGWQVYEQTRSPFALGMIGLVEIIPVFLLALPAGHLADVRDRRQIAMTVRAILALISCALAGIAFAHAPVTALFAVISLMAAVRTFYSPAVDNLLPRLVPPSQLHSAITWLSNVWQAASIVGPPIAGFAIRALGAAPVYLADALIGLAAAFLFATLPRATPHPPEEETTWGSIAAGGRFLKENPVLLAAITLDLFAVLFGGAVALLPAFAKDILEVGPTGLGWLKAATPVGALATGFLLRHLPPFRRAGLALLWAVAGFGAAAIVFGLSTSFALSLTMLALSGALDNISVVVRSTLLLTQVPDRMRGRVSAFNDIFVGASNELGGFESGLAAKYLGIVPSVMLGGVGTLIVVALTAWRAPQLRKLGALTPEPPDAA